MPEVAQARWDRERKKTVGLNDVNLRATSSTGLHQVGRGTEIAKVGFGCIEVRRDILTPSVWLCHLQVHGGCCQSQWQGETVPRGFLRSSLLLQLSAGE